ncbi:hypothetical protein Nham_0283 [Nitrobacter hamburgensis X14]|uniref:Uncharacterized protein n=1 Tax=Nitrobacter hamburgensis (strain DSM 10229 / NCIMB 13809 / X14) TaxID=323097 RepID=Q1QRG6_NITHX|nr:hypothetical protein [Nitrobacter hamburgensis]ABE61181.1 hypothetical protein Nham_0283 [Nitrobacter hamburgensis X14]
MYKLTPTRRSRGHAAIATAATPDIRAARAATLAEMDRKRQLALAEDEVAQAREVLEKAKSLSAEQAALDVAMARLTELQTAQTSDNGSKKTKAA